MNASASRTHSSQRPPSSAGRSIIAFAESRQVHVAGPLRKPRCLLQERERPLQLARAVETRRRGCCMRARLRELPRSATPPVGSPRGRRFRRRLRAPSARLRSWSARPRGPPRGRACRPRRAPPVRRGSPPRTRLRARGMPRRPARTRAARCRRGAVREQLNRALVRAPRSVRRAAIPPGSREQRLRLRPRPPRSSGSSSASRATSSASN